MLLTETFENNPFIVFIPVFVIDVLPFAIVINEILLIEALLIEALLNDISFPEILFDTIEPLEILLKLAFEDFILDAFILEKLLIEEAFIPL